MKKNKTIGLALGSGGVRGLAHVGVLKTLIKAGIHIDYLAGCSIGAWVAAHYALHQDINLLEQFTVDHRRDKLVSMLEFGLHGGFIQGRKMEELFNNWLGKETFADLPIPLSVVATDLASGNVLTLHDGRIVPAVHASMAIPTFFRPVLIQDKLLVDGGISNPVPDDVVRTMGADIVIAVNLDNYPADSFNKKNTSVRHVMMRSLNIMRHHLARYSMNDADVIIEPNIPYIGIIGLTKYFRNEVGANIVQKGIYATEAALPKIQKLLNA